MHTLSRASDPRAARNLLYFSALGGRHRTTLPASERALQTHLLHRTLHICTLQLLPSATRSQTRHARAVVAEERGGGRIVALRCARPDAATAGLRMLTCCVLANVQRRVHVVLRIRLSVSLNSPDLAIRHSENRPTRNLDVLLHSPPNLEES